MSRAVYSQEERLPRELNFRLLGLARQLVLSLGAGLEPGQVEQEEDEWRALGEWGSGLEEPPSSALVLNSQ